MCGGESAEKSLFSVSVVWRERRRATVCVRKRERGREGGRERKRPLLLCEILRGFGDLVGFQEHLNPLRAPWPSCECVCVCVCEREREREVPGAPPSALRTLGPFNFRNEC